MTEAAGERPGERVRSQVALARLAREQGDLGTARSRLGDARASAAALPADAPEWVRLELEEAWLRLEEGATAEAAERFAEAERGARSALGEADPTAGWAIAGRGEALRRLGDRAGARSALEEAFRRHQGEATANYVHPAEPLGLVFELNSLGALFREEGDLAAARDALLRAAAIGGQELGAEHPLVAATLAELARVELGLGDREASLRAAARATHIAQARLPEDHPTRRAAEAALAAASGP